MARRVKANEMSLRKWYSSSVTIPGYSNITYMGFVSSCLGIVRSVVRKNLEQEINIRFTDIATAAANQKTSTIEINREYLWGHFSKEKTLQSDEAITLALGLIVHEAAHFAWSPATLLPAAEYVKSRTKLPYIENLAATLFNVVEDIYIEAQVDRTVPSISWMLEYSNNLFFPEAGFTAAFNKVKGTKVAPGNLDQVGNLLNLLIYAKTQDELPEGCTSFISSLFNLALEATSTHNLDDRYSLTLDIYETVMENVKEDAEPESSGGEGEGDDGEKEGSADSESSESKTSGSIERAAKKLAESAANHGEGERKTRKSVRLSASDLRRVERLNDSLDRDSNTEISFEPIENAGGGIPLTSIFMEKKLSSHLEPLQMDDRYVRLGEIARQRASVNRPYGLDQKRGNNIRKLYRIATDNKIFAQNQRMSNYKPMEVIILVDCSSSMDHGPHHRTRLDLACKAALGAAYGLNEGRCLVSVYGHTADVDNSETVIYTAKTFREPITGLASKMEAMRKSYTCQNRDGFAIQFVGRRFSLDNQRRRLLIVISDGSPQAGGGYRGFEGVQHTRSSVDALRKRGIDVMSISIATESIDSNNAIYGVANNVFNEDPNVIEEIVKNLILG